MIIDTAQQHAEAPIWLLAVLEPARRDGPVAMVAIEPTTAELFDALTTRMRAGGFAAVSRQEWERVRWGRSRTAAVDVVGGDLIRITTGQTSVYTGGPMPVTEAWMSAARRGRALVALLVPGTLAGAPADADKHERVAGLTSTGQLLGTMAPVRFDLPVRRPHR